MTTNVAISLNQTLLSPIKYYNKFRIIHGILTRITLPYIFIVGFVGLITNLFTILLLSTSCITKNLKHKWTLISLAGSDLILNLALLIRVIHDLAGSKSDRICIMISFLSHLAELLSALLIVLFTIQRYMAVRYPLKAAVQRSSSPIIPLLLIFLFSFTFCVALARSNLYVACHEELHLRWFIADALISFVIPFSLILIFNILIINLIRHHARSPLLESRSFIRYYRDRSKHLQRQSQANVSPRESCSITWSFIPSQRTKTIDQGSGSSSQSRAVDRRSAESVTFLGGEEILPIDVSTAATTSVLDQTSLQVTLSGTKRALCECIRSNKSHRSFERMFSSESTFSESRSNSLIDRDFVSNRYRQTAQSIRVTRMLVLVSTCFLLFNAPAHLFVIASKLYTIMDSPVYINHDELNHFKNLTNLTDDQLTDFVYIETKMDQYYSSADLNDASFTLLEDQITIHLFYIGVVITQWISYASYSINFFLYSLSGVTFRTTLRQLINKLAWFRC